MAFMTRTADLLQDAIEGTGTDHPRVRDLVPTAKALGALSIACLPDPDFVAALGLRLQAEAADLPVRPKARDTATRRTRRSPRPVVILVRRGLPRMLAGAAASVIAVGGIVGVASRSALPGQPLYPVKQIIDNAAVSLAGSDFDKGTTLLSQAQDHIVEASQLVDGASPQAGDIDVALQSAIDDVTQGQQHLQASFVKDRNPQALLAIQDFATRAIPQVDALRARVPAASVPLVTTLRSLLGTVSANATQHLAGCQTCGTAGEAARKALGIGRAGSVSPSALPRAGAATATAAATTRAGTTAPATTLPGAVAVTTGPGATAGQGGVNVPGVGATVAPAPGVGVGVGVPGVTAGTGGVTVSGGGGVSATVPVVGTATIGLPSATVGGGIGVNGGGVGLPGVNLPIPGVTVGSTTVGVGGVPLISRTCILGLLGCT